MKNDNSTKQSNASKPMLANRLLKFRFWGNFGELNEEEDICEMEMLYGDKFCFFENEPINDLFACRNYQVMQFTGLKDKNGKEIYEGDILSYNGITSNDNKIIREVNYNAENARFQSGMYLLTQSIELSEIIGNIYENPDLTQTTS